MVTFGVTKRCSAAACSLIAVVFLWNFGQALAKIVEGTLVTTQNWAFLGRFCFISRNGKFYYHVIYPKEFEVQNLLLYYDTQTQWPAVYKKPKNCLQKEGVLRADHGQIINLTDANPVSGCQSMTVSELDGEGIEREVEYWNCTYFRMFESARERWWFIAVSNCAPTAKGLRLKYKFTMINDDTDPWLMHFSADQFYILHTDLAFGILYILLFVGCCVQAFFLNSRHLFHVTYKLFMGSVLAELLGLISLCIYYGLYARDGTGIEIMKTIGKGLEAISTLVFLLLLILLAKGFTVTRARLKPTTSAKIGVFMTIYTVIYAALFFYEQYKFDPGEVLYIYESWAGYGLIFLRLIGWGWFVYAIVFTLIHYPQKSAFFTRLFLMYSVWFISAPVIVLIATFVVPKWMREKIINAVELLIALEAHFVLCILTRPSAANKNFPFHVRTTQIDIMAKTGQAGDNTLDHFTHYQYAPGGTGGGVGVLMRPFTQSSHRRTSFSAGSLAGSLANGRPPGPIVVANGDPNGTIFTVGSATATLSSSNGFTSTESTTSAPINGGTNNNNNVIESTNNQQNGKNNKSKSAGAGRPDGRTMMPNPTQLPVIRSVMSAPLPPPDM